jgi:hypothetical protein
MSVIHEHLSSLLLLALPSGLLGATQDTQLSTRKPSQARAQTVFPSTPPKRPQPGYRLAQSQPKIPSDLQSLQHQVTTPTPTRTHSSGSSRSSTPPKRVSWADGYSNGIISRFDETSMRRNNSPTRLQGFAASQKTARAHVKKARMAIATNSSVLHTSKPELGAKPLTNHVQGWHDAWHMLGNDHAPSDGYASTPSELIMF